MLGRCFIVFAGCEMGTMLLLEGRGCFQIVASSSSMSPSYSLSSSSEQSVSELALSSPARVLSSFSAV